MKTALQAMLVGIYEAEEGNDAQLIARSLHALAAAGLSGDEAMVKSALNTCHDAQSFAWDLMRAADS